MSVINPDGIPALFTCCCYTTSEAVFAMPLAAFSLQREFGIRSPSSKSTCPTKGMGRGSGWMGKGIIAQQRYFNNLSIDFEVVSCCQVVDAVDWRWLLCIVQYPGIFIHDSNLIFLSLQHAVYFLALLLTLVKFSFILLLSDQAGQNVVIRSMAIKKSIQKCKSVGNGHHFQMPGFVEQLLNFLTSIFKAKQFYKAWQVL